MLKKYTPSLSQPKLRKYTKLKQLYFRIRNRIQIQVHITSRNASKHRFKVKNLVVARLVRGKNMGLTEREGKYLPPIYVYNFVHLSFFLALHSRALCRLFSSFTVEFGSDIPPKLG